MILQHAAVSVDFPRDSLALRLFAEAESGALVACLPEGADAFRRVAARFPGCRWEENAERLAPAIATLRAAAARTMARCGAPFEGSGTAFQRRVWTALCEIPRGTTRTYGELAAALGKPGAARAVGQACAANLLLVFVPCHRVVGRQGSPRGFGGGERLLRALASVEHPVPSRPENRAR